MKNCKISDTALKGLIIYRLLCQRNVTAEEITEHIKILYPESEPLSEQSIKRYIETLKTTDIELKRNARGEYCAKHLKRMELTDDEAQLLAKIRTVFNYVCERSSRQDFNNLYENIVKSLNERDTAKLKKYTDKEKIYKISETENWDLYSIIKENKDKQFVVEYNGEEINCEVLKVYTIHFYTYLSVFDVDLRRERILYVNLINKVTPTPIRAKGIVMPVATAFRIYGNLKTNYRLRENEKILDITKTYHTVVNYGGDENELFTRILKYGSNCEIVNSETQREKFRKFVNEIIVNQKAGEIE